MKFLILIAVIWGVSVHAVDDTGVEWSKPVRLEYGSPRGFFRKPTGTLHIDQFGKDIEIPIKGDVCDQVLSLDLSGLVSNSAGDFSLLWMNNMPSKRELRGEASMKDSNSGLILAASNLFYVHDLNREGYGFPIYKDGFELNRVDHTIIHNALEAQAVVAWFAANGANENFLMDLVNIRVKQLNNEFFEITADRDNGSTRRHIDDRFALINGVVQENPESVFLAAVDNRSLRISLKTGALSVYVAGNPVNTSGAQIPIENLDFQNVRTMTDSDGAVVEIPYVQEIAPGRKVDSGAIVAGAVLSTLIPVIGPLIGPYVAVRSGDIAKGLSRPAQTAQSHLLILIDSTNQIRILGGN